ncbi:hypothetical protein [Rhodohalobacter mucosus]|uniref:Uncharacterized protein n=1 Tax=Rhodohalobacter mucosus TaxID=2079485 RepID=A0A316TQZ2_9BACT|nr:hypothetical protein [Rhodohalobacter mucosus]PWN07027.1 hypothetical protein DDZ15_07085 [Rhodohalobacter mucosus]
MKFSQISTFFFLLIISVTLLFFTSCGESSTSVDDGGDPPAIPEAIPVEVETDYFTQNQPAFSEETTAWYEAAGYAQAAAASLNSGTLLGAGFLSIAQQSNGELDDGIWEWTFTFSQGGETLTIRLTAEALGNAYQWNVYLSGNSLQSDETLDNFLFMTGTVESDGSSGNWDYYFPGFESVAMDYEWELTSETSYTSDFIYTNPDTGSQAIITYERDGDVNTVNASGDDFDTNADLLWNTSTLEGSITLDGVTTCWDSSFQEAACD